MSNANPNVSASAGLVNDRQKTAVNLLKAAADKGLAEAKSVLGHIYELGGYEN